MPNPLLSDLQLTRRDLGEPSSDRDAVNLRAARGDLHLSAGRQNLTQALLNRLYTRRGALTGLGHPEYGSRLHQLIGEPDSRRTRALAEYYVRECLASDPRVAEVVDVSFERTERNSDLRSSLVIRVTVLPVGEEPPLSLALSTTLG
jgi:phage baseplate assembly protein W